MRYGISMFGINPLFRKDPEAFLSRMKQAGYRYLEPGLVPAPIPGLEDHLWTPQDLTRFLPLCNQLGFRLESIHIFPQNLPAELSVYLPLCREAAVHELVIPCPSWKTPEERDCHVRNLIHAAQLLKEQGIHLVLHNNGEASRPLENGQCALEILLNRCEGLVLAQADVGWLLWGGIDPEAFLWRNRNLIRSLHYKDMKDTAQGMAETAIGTGLVDMMACFQFARAQEIIQYADQDGSEGNFLTDLINTANRFRELSQARVRTKSTLCVLDTETLTVQKLQTFDQIIEAPNWMQTDPDSLIYNSDGQIYRYRISEGTSTRIESGHCTNCNNDHVLSPDETQIAVSHSEHSWMSQIYILPLSGGEPRLITPKAPSYLHGWSPDGKELSYCAFRDHGKGYEVDIFAISPAGGEEWQLTKNAGFNDGPEYSPDGKQIWFISTRTGLMQCWRMNRDGSQPTQMTFLPRNNWFPHVSPDGRQVVYLSYSREGLDPNEHLPNMQVQLRLMNADGSEDHKLLDFFGGQGSINVNSWHPDSRHLAFVMYELEHR